MDETALTDVIAPTEVPVDSMVLVSLRRPSPVSQDGLGLHAMFEVGLYAD